MQNTHPSQTPPSSSTSVLSDGFFPSFLFFSSFFFPLVGGVSLGMFAEHFFGSILFFAIGLEKPLLDVLVFPQFFRVRDKKKCCFGGWGRKKEEEMKV